MSRERLILAGSDRSAPYWWIYFAKSATSGKVKVGRTVAIRRRLIALKAAHQQSFELLAMIPVLNRDAESVFHDMLAPWRVTDNVEREWYAINDARIHWAIERWLKCSHRLLIDARRKRNTPPAWLKSGLVDVRLNALLMPEERRRA